MLFGAYEQKLKEIRNAKGDDPAFNYLQELKQFTGTKYADALKLTERYIYKERFIPIGDDIPEEVFMLNIFFVYKTFFYFIFNYFYIFYIYIICTCNNYLCIYQLY